MRDYYERNPHAAYTPADRLPKYGITAEQFEAMFEAQGRRCKICRTDKPGAQTAGRWHIDHDHACCPGRKGSCGKCLRGILCGNCNLGLGNMKDDPVIVRAALDYLVAYQARRAAEDHGNPMSENGAATIVSLQGIARFAETALGADSADVRSQAAAAHFQPADHGFGAPGITAVHLVGQHTAGPATDRGRRNSGHRLDRGGR